MRGTSGETSRSTWPQARPKPVLRRRVGGPRKTGTTGAHSSVQNTQDRKGFSVCRHTGWGSAGLQTSAYWKESPFAYPPNRHDVTHNERKTEIDEAFN